VCRLIGNLFSTHLRPVSPLRRRLSAKQTDVRAWSDEDLWNAIEQTKAEQLDWKNTTGSARKWWEAFEQENKHRPALIFRLAEELRNRNATIAEFFLAFVYSNTDNIQANLHYLDYKRLKDSEERKKSGEAK
jgi:ATP-dependent Clp protease ATP-binding subunit ClpX